MIKRLFDIFFSLLGILLLMPIFLLISIVIKLSDKGTIIYKQKRVGRYNKEFYILKFRTMKIGSDKQGLLTVGDKDSRITGAGYFLRKTKMDELPQLFNVFMGQMSFVGPRPEVRKYVNMYNSEQLKVLKVRPGITDIASMKFRNENEILAKSKQPEKTYIETVMPEKLKMNLHYIDNSGFFIDIKIILLTIHTIIFK